MRRNVILAIARKDILDALRNARLLIIVLMPIGFSILYGYLFRDTSTKTEIVLHSPETSALAAQLDQMPNVSLFSVDSPQAVETTLEKEKAALGLVLPVGFDEGLHAGTRPTLEMIYPEAPEEAQSARLLVLETLEVLSGRESVVEVDERQLHPQTQEEREAASEQPMSFLNQVGLQGYFVILWVMMAITMNGAFLVPTLLVEEKEKKTLDAVLVAPTTYTGVVIGKVLVGMIYSLLSAFVVMGLNQGFTGDIPFAVTTIIVGSLALSLIGLLIGGLIENMTSLNTWGSFIILPLMIPGFLAGVPLDSISPALSVPLQAIPTFQVVRGLALAMQGRGIETRSSLGILGIQCLLLFGAVVWSLRRRES